MITFISGSTVVINHCKKKKKEAKQAKTTQKTNNKKQHISWPLGSRKRIILVNIF